MGVLDSIGNTPLVRLESLNANPARKGFRQARREQSRRLGQGPDRASA